jgi:quercetin dioxygenase-like cupin family protein
MKVIQFDRMIKESKNIPIYKSHNGCTTLYEVVFLHGEGIQPHLHPYGEDCAIVLSGRLTYYVNNRETIDVNQGEVVFGWKNVIHGYRNQDQQPLHLLVFVTPNKLGLDYLDDQHPNVIHLPIKDRKLSRFSKSEFSSFQYLQISGDYKEEKEEGIVKVFVDVHEKTIFVFDHESVHLHFSKERKVLKYVAKS